MEPLRPRRNSRMFISASSTSGGWLAGVGAPRSVVTAVFFCGIGKPNPGTGWLTSIENNVMEKGVGQWWSVNGAIIDCEGEWITEANELYVPYKMEGKGERNIVWKPGGRRMTATSANGITPPFDVESVFGNWNTVEDSDVRRACIAGLAVARDANSALALRESFPRELDPASRDIILRTLGAMKDPGTLALVVEELKLPSNPGTTLAAIAAAEDIGGEPAVQSLSGFLSSSNATAATLAQAIADT